MFPTLVRRLAQAPKPQILESVAKAATEAASNPPRTKLKKVWPPDMMTMSPQQQLRFEKKFKRRLKMATLRPGWDKGVRLAQYFTIAFVLVYTALFMDWKDMPNPYGGLRESFWGFFGSFTQETRALEPAEQPRHKRP
ncbi:hypothetical protein QBC40DRAFT_108297 [Triangularia verruculosa]|uniref:Uncharacterized protein n=1 Tax=Triangularia verruculosa TaxID=2587418 RepID=A0AAN7ASN1_9PEZI|nr:hypothetical protein QBC40DRAFT_108297 [Triangularia verruculosa]